MRKLSADQIAEWFEPCPFCDDGINVFQAMHPTLKEPAWYIESKNMGCILSRVGGFLRLSDLISAWNERGCSRSTAPELRRTFEWGKR